MRYYLILAVIGFSTIGRSQSFIKNTTGRSLTFKEIQLQFDDFKKTQNLDKTRGWKMFKRYEAEMVLHTNGHGEPDGFADYIEEAIRSSEEKSAKGNSNVTWYPTGPSDIPENRQFYAENGVGRVNCVAFHPTSSSIYYVGVAQGGVWKTTNGGISYTPLTDNLPVTRISDICLDPNNPNTIYISVCDFEYVGTGLYLDGRKRHTHYGVGVYKSTNAGQTWAPTGLTFQLTDGDASLIRRIIVNHTNSSEVLACGVNGMYKSTDGGATWTKKLDSLFWEMEQVTSSGNVVYAATGWVKNSAMGQAAIFKSIDFGNTWTKLTTSIPATGGVQRIELEVAPSNINYVYALCVDDQSGFYGIYRSTNGGNSWTFQSGSPNILSWDEGYDAGGQGTYDLALCVDYTDPNKLYVGGINIWSSSDGGVNFYPATHWTYKNGVKTIHADIHAIQQQPGTHDFFVACDGGLYKTGNIQTGSWNSPWTTDWTNLSGGMQVASFYRISSSKNTADRLAAGAQDNSTFYRSGSNWSSIKGGDGMDNYLSPLNNQHALASSQYGNFGISTDDGFNVQPVNCNPLSESAEWTAPVVADYKQPNVVYIGNENIVRSDDFGETWTSLSSIYSNTIAQSNTEISALALSPTNSLVLYAARRVRHEINMKGFVFRTTDGGQSFTPITSNLPDSLYCTGIEVSPASSNEAAICMAGFAAGQKVYKTTNGGSSWTNISFNLPNIPVNCIKYVEQTGQLLAGTDLGVYVLNKNANTWVKYSDGLPNVIISDIEINPAANKIYVSTFGRGIWETALQGVVATSLDEQNQGQLITCRVYPSVNDGKFTLETPGSVSSKVEIIDIMGRVVYKTQIQKRITQLALDLPSGAYYVKVAGEATSSVQKIVIE
jgi:photosystem II stability/assembly factor-like uncharacterized protein